MVKLNESVLKPHVNDYVKMDLKRTRKKAAFYMLTHFVNISKILKLMNKMEAATDRFLQTKNMNLEQIDAVFTEKEINLLLKVFREALERSSIDELKKYKVPVGVKIEQINADGVPAEWQIVPGANEDKVLLYYHGGGFCLMSPATHRILTIDIALQTKVKVLSVDYRLLPEHSPLDTMADGFTAYKWLLAQGIKPENIIMGGDSAGGGITLFTLLKLREVGVAMPGGAVCLSPVADFNMADDEVLQNLSTDPVLGTNGIVILFMNFLRVLPQELDKFMPLKSSLEGLPPMLFQATTCEMLFAHSKRIVEKAKADGVQAELQTWDGMIHIFQVFGMNYFPEAKEATAKIAAFINERLKS